MAILKISEVTCDFCGNVIGHYQGTKANVERQIIYDGSLVQKAKHYCSPVCLDDQWKQWEGEE